MDRKKLSLILITVLLIFSNLASASMITFVDTAGVSNGTLAISGSNGTELRILNSTESYQVYNNTVYHLDYQSSGLYPLHDEKFLGYQNGNVTPPEFNGLKFYISYFSNPLNIIMVLWVGFLALLVVIAWFG
jgi:hypothetical protein